ncbi:MAG: UDP-N-acetylmuramoyl-tripeptide--D-alanyl-D-alanine ligase [Clostridia bacterium]|nr:UDP-N-acetylmuramoyl-tripeptide--D-alanyl-D-alanine ligase [Clostridia bacterium]
MLNVREILEATNGELLNGDINKNIVDYKFDSREINEGDFYIPIIGERVDGHKFITDTVKSKCVGFFTSEEIELNEIINLNNEVVIIKVEDTLKSLQDIGRYNRNKKINIDVIGITGSVGKTSTREMIASVISQEKDTLVTQKNMNGHIGLPLMTLKMENQAIAVLEAGIDFVGEMDVLKSLLLPDVAVVTNIGTSHIGKFGSQDVIYQEKLKIADTLKGKKILLLNKDDKYLREYKNDKINIIYYSIDDAKDIIINEDSITFTTNIYNKEEKLKINALGNHNILNAIAAIRIGEIYNLPVEKIITGVEAYRNFSRRMEKININGLTIIDDTYNASPSSTKSGLETVNNLNANRKIAVLADILELGDYAKDLHIQLGRVFKYLKYDIVVAFGENMKYLVESAKEYVKEIYWVEDSIKAEEKIRSIMQEDDIIYFKGSNAMKVNSIIENIKKDFMN